MRAAPKWFAKYLMYYPVSRVMAGNVPGWRNEYLESQYFPRERLRELQLEKLNALVSSARSNCPFYAEKFAGLDTGFRSLEGLRRLPFLVKEDLQEDQDRIRSRVSCGRLVSKTSGGSTGQPVTILKTRAAWAQELGATWRGYNWAGIDMGDSQARFWGVPLDAKSRLRSGLIDFSCNRTRLSAFRFTRDDLHRYYRELNRFRPHHYYGYVSMLMEFGEFLVENGLEMEYPPKCILTTSEVLTAGKREFLENVFSTRVFNEYGCGELGTIAHECEGGSLHLSEENMIVEICDGDTVCPDGVMGEIVVTELNNPAMPLIRYRTGDFGMISDQPCSCGRTLGILDGLYGRAYDMIKTRDGRVFHGEFMLYIFEEIKRRQKGVRQFQVVQLEYDRFLVRIVRDAGFDDSTLEFIKDKILREIDPGARVEFEFVESIQREKSGKMRLIVGLDSPRK